MCLASRVSLPLSSLLRRCGQGVGYFFFFHCPLVENHGTCLHRRFPVGVGSSTFATECLPWGFPAPGLQVEHIPACVQGVGCPQWPALLHFHDACSSQHRQQSQNMDCKERNIACVVTGDVLVPWSNSRPLETPEIPRLLGRNSHRETHTESLSWLGLIW